VLLIRIGLARELSICLAKIPKNTIIITHTFENSPSDSLPLLNSIGVRE
jgi:hypothetical protein